jgi:hypothetical protein
MQSDSFKVSLGELLLNAPKVPKSKKTAENHAQRQSSSLQPKCPITQRFKLKDVMKAYDTFGNAEKEHVL